MHIAIISLMGCIFTRLRLVKIPRPLVHYELAILHANSCNKVYLLRELACNIANYCTSGRGIFTSRRRVKMQPTVSEIIAICMLASVIKCLLSTPE